MSPEGRGDDRAMQEILETMRRVLARRFGIETDAVLSADRPLSTLGMDSLAFIEYAFELEGELKVTFPDIPRDLDTIGDLARFVQAEVVRQRAAAA
jgi:acyl carrier protein